MTYRKTNPSGREMAGIGIIGCVVVLGLLLFGFGISTLLMMFAWNIVVPSVFGGPTLGLLEAFGLVLLLWIIGGAFRSAVSIRKE
jgi:hypothetical protein